MSITLPVLISPNTAMSTRPARSFSAMRPNSSRSADNSRSSSALQPRNCAIAACIAAIEAA